MRFVFTSAVKDLRRLRREPVTILTWLGIPTFVALILVVIFGRAEPQPHGILLLVDEDGGLGATLLTGAFSQGPLGKMIAIEKVSRDDGRRRIDKGDGSALLIVPKGFTTAFLQSKPAKLELVRNPAQRILPDIIEQTLSMLTDGAFYLQVVAGGQLRLMAGRGAGTDARNVGNIIAGLRKYLSPRVIQLQTKVIEEKIERPGGFASLMLPGMLYMAVFFIAGGLAADVWRERTSGALRRVATTPATFGSFLAGKLLAAFAVLAAVGAFGLMVAHWLVDLPVPNFAMAVLWIAASGAGLYLFMMLLQSMASTERVASLLTNFVMLPLTMLGGGFFPFEAMPQSFARVGRLTPNGWSVTQLQNILSGSVAFSAFAGVVIFLAAAWLVAVWRIRRTVC